MATVVSAVAQTNTATITNADQFDPNTANNTASATETPQQAADLSITKTDGTASVLPGSLDTYTIVVANNGPDAVTGASDSDFFPSAITSANWTAVASPGSSVAQPVGAGNIATTVDLLPGGNATFTVAAQISPLATGTISNTASVTAPAGVTDNNVGNNSATDTDIVTPLLADLGITKTDGLTTAVQGTLTTYTIIVTNTGPNAVTGASVSDFFPSAITSVNWSAIASAESSVAQPFGTGNIATTVNLLAGGDAIFTAAAQISPAAIGPMSNAATVTAPAGVTDTNLSNNSTTDTDLVIDVTSPTVTINQAAAQSDPALDAPILFTVVFSEPSPNSTGATSRLPDRPSAARWQQRSPAAARTTPCRSPG